jgi:hypothetical protein
LGVVWSDPRSRLDAHLWKLKPYFGAELYFSLRCGYFTFSTRYRRSHTGMTKVGLTIPFGRKI